jgi:hypothetical protein
MLFFMFKIAELLRKILDDSNNDDENEAWRRVGILCSQITCRGTVMPLTPPFSFSTPVYGEGAISRVTAEQSKQNNI